MLAIRSGDKEEGWLPQMLKLSNNKGVINSCFTPMAASLCYLKAPRLLLMEGKKLLISFNENKKKFIVIFATRIERELKYATVNGNNNRNMN